MLQFYYVSLNQPTYDVDGYIGSCKRIYMTFTITMLLYITQRLQVTMHHLKVYKRMIHIFLIFSIVQNRFATSSSSTLQSMEVDDYLCNQFEFQEDHEILKWQR